MTIWSIQGSKPDRRCDSRLQRHSHRQRTRQRRSRTYGGGRMTFVSENISTFVRSPYPLMCCHGLGLGCHETTAAKLLHRSSAPPLKRDGLACCHNLNVLRRAFNIDHVIHLKAFITIGVGQQLKVHRQLQSQGLPKLRRNGLIEMPNLLQPQH